MLRRNKYGQNMFLNEYRIGVPIGLTIIQHQYMLKKTYQQMNPIKLSNNTSCINNKETTIDTNQTQTTNENNNSLMNIMLFNNVFNENLVD